MSIRLSYSLRARLLFFLLAAIAVGALVQGAIAYRSTLAQADDIFDSLLQRTALFARCRRPDHPALDPGRPAGLQFALAPPAARPDCAGVLRRPDGRHYVPRVFAGHAVPGDPGRAGHGRAQAHGARARPAHHRPHRRGRSPADADHLVRGQLVAAPRQACPRPGGGAAARGPVSSQRAGPAR
ncbi:hypothetical protein G6F50_015328 [Rhizopus delemar]|uniref:Uncharacterized protein n=1 Tax=Rhizopus delemar TaxID=936053 RepID=A0A9P7C4Y4_9FUNG|nr:hypothetical protein G6F50_015328 [Rhizopus delemar]